MTAEIETGARESAYEMACSSKGYRILSSGLYSDGILAVVRETIHNAIDAQISVNRHHIPIRVHLPHPEAMFFAVRDFGPGIDDDKMREVYATYFGSSKTGDNIDFAGRLGLGSKAPFAYTLLFNVSVFQKGVRRDYTLFFNRNDEPVLTPCLEHLTDEPDGLEVSVAVHTTSDAAIFADRTRQVCEFLACPPEIHGGSLPEPPEQTILLETENGRLFWDNMQSRRTQRVVQNQIAYPISRSELRGIDIACHRLLNLPLVLYMEPNSVQFVPSREHLTYDGESPSRASIERRLSAFADDLAWVYMEKFRACETEYDARMCWQKLKRQKGWSSVVDTVPPIWRDQKLTNNVIQVKNFPANSLRVTAITYRSDGSHLTKKDVPLYGNAFFTFGCGALTHFYINDSPRGSLTKVVDLARQGFKKDDNLHEPQNTIYYVSGDIEMARSIVPLLKGCPHTFTSTLVARDPRKQRERLKARAIRYNHRYEGKLHNPVDRSFDVETGGYHLVTRNNSPDHPTITTDSGRWTAFYRRCREEQWFNVDNDHLALLPLTIARGHILRTDRRWPNFITAMQEKARARYDTPENRLALARYAQLSAITDRFPYIVHRVEVDWQALAETLPPDHLIARAWRSYHEWNLSTDMAKATQSAIDALGIALKVPTIVDEPAQHLERMNNRYPMLRLILGARSSRPIEEQAAILADYIASIDRAYIATLPAAIPAVVRARPRTNWRMRMKKK